MGKAAKRARKKQGRRDRIAAETKAAEQRRKRNLNIVLGVIVVAAVAFLAIHQLTKKSTTTVSTSGSPTPAATPSPLSSPSTAASSAATTTAASCPSAPKPAQGNHATQASPPPMTISKTTTYTAAFSTTCGDFVMTLDAKESPNTVNSFVYLAKKGFFNGLDFHRISHTANVIQGGDPNGDGSGGPGYTVVDPVPSSLNSGTYGSGLVAMAKTGSDPNGTAGSQFFIVPPGVSSDIGPDYALLGNVTSGLDVVGKIFADIPSGQASYDGAPAVPVYITTVTVTP
ncbi:MAG TPA: peptidylprolyl isomerase [Actinomycetota bacterium]|nr:peptidylprolyl isomerase [Actinomycetota bacterium]